MNGIRCAHCTLSCVQLFASPWTPGSSIHGIFQARILDWVVISFSIANIQAKILDRPSFDYEELQKAHEAWKGKFDEIYKIRKEG